PVLFQAEDGIRDRNVTGVQTCALPICDGRPAARPCAARGGPPLLPWPRRLKDTVARASERMTTLLDRDAIVQHLLTALREVLFRSEERRVGKECRSGGGQIG